MAENKTEKPTPRRIAKARAQGNVARSQDLPILGTFLAAFIFFIYYFPFAKRKLEELFFYIFNLISQGFSLNFENFFNLANTLIKIIMLLLIPPLLTFLVVGLTINFIQVGFLFTTAPLGFNFSRINPITGLINFFKRFFEVTFYFELLKSIFKFIVVGAILLYIFKGYFYEILSFSVSPPENLDKFIAIFIIKMLFFAFLISIPLGLADYYFQRWRYLESLKMTKQEVKEEMKAVEGNPEIKKRIRRKMIEIFNRRKMIKRVKEADVVITNPTHYAVALRYKPPQDTAPIVVAKGVDRMAKLIIEEAKKHRIPIFREPVLARTLYHSVDINEPIPVELYRAVAKILGRLQKYRRLRRNT